ncbi:MAG: AAA family ATPase [Acidimicrobiales bacterium]
MDANPRQPADALALAIAAGVPTVLWGAPGTGKSSAVAALSASFGLPCEVVIASIREPSDFGGLPIVVDGGVRFAPPAWAVRLADEGRGVLFLDEISTAPPAVQAALLRVVLERVVGDLALPDEIAIVAAANPPEQAADGWDLSAPLANRFCHLDWTVEAHEVAAGLVAGFPAPTAPELPAGWTDQIPLAAGVVAGFLGVRPSLVVAPPTDRAAAGRAWPSPRTWEMAIRLIAACQMADMSAGVRSALVRGVVGDGAGLELLTWMDELDLPDPEAALADPDGVEFPDRGDRVYAVLSSVAAAVTANTTPERWRAGWQVMARASDQSPDIAAMAARVLARIRPEGESAPPEAARFVPVLRDAGMV